MVVVDSGGGCGDGGSSAVVVDIMHSGYAYISNNVRCLQKRERPTDRQIDRPTDPRDRIPSCQRTFQREH